MSNDQTPPYPGGGKPEPQVNDGQEMAFDPENSGTWPWDENGHQYDPTKIKLVDGKQVPK